MPASVPIPREALPSGWVPPSKRRLLLRGLLKHCARCGQGHLFRHWFTMVPTCPRCGLHFDREPGWVLGAMTINTAFMFIVALPTMLAGFIVTYPDIPVFAVSAVTVVAAGLAAIVGYPFSKTVWIAIDLMMVPEGMAFDGDGPGSNGQDSAGQGSEGQGAKRKGSDGQGSEGPGPTRSSSAST
jgi:uncharacterized protein (DUF983 family)